MARVKRCIFCGKKLRADGYCINTQCVDYERTKIHDGEATEEVTEKANESGVVK